MGWFEKLKKARQENKVSADQVVYASTLLDYADRFIAITEGAEHGSWCIEHSAWECPICGGINLRAYYRNNKKAQEDDMWGHHESCPYHEDWKP